MSSRSADWQSVPIKYLVTCNDDVLSEATPPDRRILYVDIGNVQYGVGITAFEALPLSEAPSRARRLVRDGDIIISTVRTYLRAIACIEMPDERLVVSTGFAVMRPGPRLNPRFFGYAMHSELLIDDIVARSIGVSYPAISSSELIRLRLPLPNLTTQKAIADFLDRETAEADSLVSRYERLVELLEEKRESLITQAVTKGLDPGVPMKDSGINWIGEIPDHWTCANLTRFATRVVVGIAEAATHAYVADGVPILRSTNIRPSKIEGPVLQIDRAFAMTRGSKTIRAGDLVTVRTGNAGVTAVVPAHLDGCQCFTMLITTLARDHTPEFFSFALNSHYGQRFFALEAWGTAQANISVPILKEFPVAVPPPEEQKEIVRHVVTALASIDALSEKAYCAIALLRSRRTALITAAVTGKLDAGTYAIAKPLCESAT